MLTADFDRALLLATKHHGPQLRKGSRIPYVSHLLGVTSLVLEAGGGETEAIAHKQPDELLVSIADKLHNARAILLDYRAVGEELWGRFNEGEGASVLWYYRALFEAFSARRGDLSAGAVALLEELGRTLDELEELVAEVL